MLYLMLHLTRVNEGLHTSFKNQSWLRSGDVTIYYDDQISLNQALQSQEIDTQWFLPFTLYGLQSYTSLREALINVSLRHIYNEPLITRRLLLTWNADTPVLAPTCARHDYYRVGCLRHRLCYFTILHTFAPCQSNRKWSSF